MGVLNFSLLESSCRGLRRSYERLRQASARDHAKKGFARQPGFNPLAQLPKRFDIDAGVESHRFQQEGAILRIDIAGRSRRERTAAQAGERSGEMLYADVKSGMQIGDAKPASIVKMGAYLQRPHFFDCCSE